MWLVVMIYNGNDTWNVHAWRVGKRGWMQILKLFADMQAMWCVPAGPS